MHRPHNLVKQGVCQHHQKTTNLLILMILILKMFKLYGKRMPDQKQRFANKNTDKVQKYDHFVSFVM